jgi:hypothetical protein
MGAECKSHVSYRLTFCARTQLLWRCARASPHAPGMADFRMSASSKGLDQCGEVGRGQLVYTEDRQ